MIYRWNLVDTETFKDIFKTFWNKEGKTANLVLEVQNFLNEYEDVDYDPRIFFGYKINIKDWKEYNDKSALDKIKEAESLGIDFTKETKLSMCMIDEYGRPGIIPLRSQTHLDNIIFKGFVDRNPEAVDDSDPSIKILSVMASSFTNIRLIKNSKGILKLEGKGKPYIRTRVMDYKDWEENINFLTKNKHFPIEFVENDINI